MYCNCKQLYCDPKKAKHVLVFWYIFVIDTLTLRTVRRTLMSLCNVSSEVMIKSIQITKPVQKPKTMTKTRFVSNFALAMFSTVAMLQKAYTCLTRCTCDASSAAVAVDKYNQNIGRGSL